MRDHRKLRAFELADNLAVSVYRFTRVFPRDEQFGLTSQMRRAAVSIASNIVEGAGRESLAEYLRFLDMAYASAKELEYQVSLALRLEYLDPASAADVSRQSTETAKVLGALIRALRTQADNPRAT
jgi:four helix bundle protein